LGHKGDEWIEKGIIFNEFEMTATRKKNKNTNFYADITTPIYTQN
jgi:hypothetical protein